MKGNHKALVWLTILLAILLAIEVPLLIGHHRHNYFKIDGAFAFYAVLGIAASILLGLLARLIGPLIRHDESFYDEAKDESLPEDIDESLR